MSAEDERANPTLAAHGRLSPARLEAVAIHAYAHVIGPAARALLDAYGGAGSRGEHQAIN